MTFIHLDEISINTEAIAYIKWVVHHKHYGAKCRPSIQVTLLASAGGYADGEGCLEQVHLYFLAKGRDAEILRSHFGLPYQPELGDFEEPVEELLEDEEREQHLVGVGASSDDLPDIPF